MTKTEKVKMKLVRITDESVYGCKGDVIEVSTEYKFIDNWKHFSPISDDEIRKALPEWFKDCGYTGQWEDTYKDFGEAKIEWIECVYGIDINSKNVTIGTNTYELGEWYDEYGDLFDQDEAYSEDSYISTTASYRYELLTPEKATQLEEGLKLLKEAKSQIEKSLR